MLTNSITLSNETILKSQNMIKWLKIWIDRKLTFKTHVEKRLIFAIKVFYSINRLQNFQWNLAFKTSSISIIEIEINIQSIKIQLNQKNQKLALRIMKLDQRHFIRLKTFWNYSSERTHESTEIIEIEFESGFMKFIIEKN